MSERHQSLFSLFHLGLSIHHLNQKAERQLGLSLGQWCVLKHLIDMPSVSAQALARAVGVHPSTLTQALKRLELRRLLFIAEDPKDSRKKLISITRQGRDVLQRAEQVLGKHADGFSEVNEELLRVRERIATQIASL